MNREEQRIPQTIRLENASGLTVRVTIEDERFTRVVMVAGCTIEDDAVKCCRALCEFQLSPPYSD